MTDFEASELFTYLQRKERIGTSSETASYHSKDTQDQSVDLQYLDVHFEKWFREEDSLNAFTNSKLTQ